MAYHLKATTVENLKAKYLSEKSRKRKLFDYNSDVTKLIQIKRGRPLILGQQLDTKSTIFNYRTQKQKRKH